MALRAIVGLTGDGKSSFATGKLWEALIEDHRPIVTNCAIRLHPWVNKKGKAFKGLLATLRELYGDTFDAERRIVFLTKEEEIEKFFLCRPHVPEDPDLPTEVRWIAPPEKVNDNQLFKLDGNMHGGCHFFIEETHEYLGKDKSGKAGKLTRSWASQNRRAGDDAWWISQVPGLVCKELRDQTRETFVMVNHGLRSMFIWRQPNVFTYRVYLRCPTEFPVADPPMTGGQVRYDRQALWECFDTSSGAGVSGTVADIGTRAKGLHWTTIPLALAVTLILALVGMRSCARAISDSIAFKSKPPLAISKALAHVAPPPATNTPQNTFVALQTKTAETNKATVSGILSSGKRFLVIFSDGVQADATDVRNLGRKVLVDGVPYDRTTVKLSSGKTP